MRKDEIKLEATSAHGARREASRRWPKNDVSLHGYTEDGECVYISLVRNVTKGNVATATKGRAAVRFTAKPVEPPLKLGTKMRSIELDESKRYTEPTDEIMEKLLDKRKG